MVDFMNWILLFFKDAILMLAGLTSVDGYSFGKTLLAVTIVGAVVSATIGSVAIVSRTIRNNSYAATRHDRAAARNKSVSNRLDSIERGIYGGD